MNLNLLIGALVGVLGLGLVVFLLLRRRGASGQADAPPSSPERKPVGKAEKPTPTEEPAPKAKESREKEEPEKSRAEPVSAPTADATERSQEESADGYDTDKSDSDQKPAEPGKPSKEDIAALKKGLASTRGGFIARLAKLFGRKPEIDPQLLEEVQEVLITADIGVRTSEKILGRLRERLDRNELSDEERIWQALREEAMSVLAPAQSAPPDLSQHTPSVILVVGVNGVGKTTTIGKLASRYQDEGKKVILAAGDTFRAAAVLQLEVWGRRVGCEVVKGKERADPAAVIFDAIKKAGDEKADLVIADTAGRLHTKTNLMEELKKVVRSAGKALGRPVDEVLLVLDSTTGQNAIQQAQLFKGAIEVSAVALTKLDGTAKGGVILGIVDEHALPVRYVGIGERVEDLREFDAKTFVEALFTKPDDESLAA